jgi:hypothetical protein
MKGLPDGLEGNRRTELLEVGKTGLPSTETVTANVQW